jgi:hypothetical protein
MDNAGGPSLRHLPALEAVPYGEIKLALAPTHAESFSY